MSTFEIGKYYAVPCVHGRIYNMVRWWPVLGGFHEDSEFINFPHWHWHLDARFVSRGDLESIGNGRHKGPLTMAARRVPLMLSVDSTDQFRGAVKFAPTNHPKPELRRRLCKHQWEDQDVVDRADWIKPLEAAFAKEKLAKGHCPHRGADLTTFPIDKHGCVECPLHGLRWHVESGRMVPRAAYREMERRACA